MPIMRCHNAIAISPMLLSTIENARVGIWGAGREGRAAVDTLRRRFPGKTLTWIVAAKEQAEIGALALRDVSVVIEGGIDLATFDVVVKSPGISLYRPDIEEACLRGTRFTSGTAIWFSEHSQARTICVTGTKGKSSTTALIAHLLRNAGVRTALAGNIGLPLLALDETVPAQWHVIELSSFQTADLDIAPDVAVLTSLVEEHLDWHGNGERYRRDKLRLLRRAAHCVLPIDLEHVAESEGRILCFETAAGWHVEGGSICSGMNPLMPLDALPVRGVHNAINACAALAALDAAGFDARSSVPNLRTFRPLPHRLQELGRRNGVLYVNDSIATTPAAMLAALACYRSEPLALILGGYDRGLDWRDAIVRLAESRLRLVCTQGENGPYLANELRKAAVPVRECDDIPTAVSLASMAVQDGGIVLLSPGAPSFPVFRDYTERGRAFAAAAGFDPAVIGAIEGMGVA
jgi:UDP-N-acetylmuramoylalanine--D-glutamate ligase